MIKLFVKISWIHEQKEFMDLLNELGIQIQTIELQNKADGYSTIINISEEDANLFKLCCKDFIWKESGDILCITKLFYVKLHNQNVICDFPVLGYSIEEH